MPTRTTKIVLTGLETTQQPAASDISSRRSFTLLNQRYAGGQELHPSEVYISTTHGAIAPDCAVHIGSADRLAPGNNKAKTTTNKARMIISL